MTPVYISVLQRELAVKLGVLGDNRFYVTINFASVLKATSLILFKSVISLELNHYINKTANVLNKVSAKITNKTNFTEKILLLEEQIRSLNTENKTL